MIQSAEHLLGVKGIFTVEVAAILFCVHTAVGAAASRKGGTKSQYLFKSVLHFLLNRAGVFLHLPSVVGRADIADGQKISHKIYPFISEYIIP